MKLTYAKALTVVFALAPLSIGGPAAAGLLHAHAVTRGVIAESPVVADDALARMMFGQYGVDAREQVTDYVDWVETLS